MGSVLVRASSKSHKLSTHCRGSGGWAGKGQHALRLPEQPAAGGRGPLCIARSRCASPNTRAHSALHAQWARRKTTLSLLTQHRQLASSFPLFITALLQLAAKLAEKSELLLCGAAARAVAERSPGRLGSATAASICLHKQQVPWRPGRDAGGTARGSTGGGWLFL